jgi:pyruvate dehydrogenase E1 component alpha subunit
LENPPTGVTTSKEELLKFFTDMSLWRRVEVAADNLYKNKMIRGFLHLYNGQVKQQMIVN